MDVIAKYYYVPKSKRKGWTIPLKDWLFEVVGEVVSFCCGEMKDAEEDGFIGFGEYDSMCNTNANMNIYICHPYPEGACWDSLAIKICPFCGDEIRIIRKDMKRMR